MTPWLLALLGCVAPENPQGTLLPPLTPQPPDIVDGELGCSLDDAQWTLTVNLSGWGGRVRSWWSADGLYVEDHLLSSQSYAEDGTGEDYQLLLSIAADFRLVEEGRATALSCGSSPSVLVSVDDLEGKAYDCMVFPGSDVDWATIEGVTSCAP